MHMTQAWLNVAQIVDATAAEGPGLRFVVWVQGCNKRCRGCCNPNMLKLTAANLMPAQEVIERLRQVHAQQPLEGITLLGGEPFLQAKGLAPLAQAAQEMGLSVMVFTGYLREELTNDFLANAQELLAHTDVLIDGEFIRELQETTRNYVGSTNQRFHYLTDFYDARIETMPVDVTNEWRIQLDGTIIANGLPFKFVQRRKSSS